MGENLDPVLARACVDELLVGSERAVGLSGDDELVVLTKPVEGLEEDVKPLVFANEAEEKDVLPAGLESEGLLRLLARDALAEMRIEGMGHDGAGLAGVE